ncbi:MAG: peptide deformylase [Rhizobiales bacterium]|nr:peptide deformylase [Hyphomicrobiales bacterium]
MAVRQILTLPEPILRRVAEPVTKVDDGVRALLDDMLETMYDAPGIGLAAVQIGVARRIVVADCADKEAEPEPRRFINPEIVWVSQDLNEHEEGCLSIPEFYEMVERPAACRVRYLDETGAERELECEGLLATCIQHEVDHLNGILFIDHISRLKRERITRKFVKAAKEREREMGTA